MHQLNTKVGYQRYGKGCVRVVKVHKGDKKQEVTEITAAVQLEGNFDDSYYTGDNASIVATDSIKNTVYVLSKENDTESIEDFALVICRHFLKQYAHVSGVIVKVLESPWDRLVVNGVPHAHAFQMNQPYVRFVDVHATREGSLEVTSGLDKLQVMKTTQSGFVNFVRDRYTTLPEVKDRMMKTSVTAKWEYTPDVLASMKQAILSNNSKVLDFNKLFHKTKDSLIEVFAGDVVHGTYSPSVQQTLYLMGTKALDTQKSIQSISLSMPNRHNILFDLSRFGLKNENEIFFPSDEPYGLIEATIVRGKPSRPEGNGTRLLTSSRL